MFNHLARRRGHRRHHHAARQRHRTLRPPRGAALPQDIEALRRGLCGCGSDSAQQRRPRTHRCLYRGPPLVKRQADRLADGRRRRIRIYVKKLSRAVQKKVLAETVLKRSAACAMSASSGKILSAQEAQAIARGPL